MESGFGACAIALQKQSACCDARCSMIGTFSCSRK